jgi:DNA-binding MarR family transcriptional regulator
MELKGLVLRAMEPKDRRHSRIVLTAKGRATQRRCAPLVLGLLDDYFREFSAAEMSGFIHMLKRLRLNVETRGIALAADRDSNRQARST